MIYEYQEFKLNSVLSRYIDCVWTESYTQRPENKGRTYLVVPDNTVELIFTSGTLERKIKDGLGKVEVLGSHLSGLKTIAQDVKVDGEMNLSVRFKPHGLYPFIKPRLQETINQSIPIEDLFGKDILELESQLFETHCLLDRVRHIETYFLKRLLTLNRQADATFDYLINRIVDGRGAHRILDLAEETGVTIKTFERKFLQNLGVSPKQCGQLIRLFHTLKATNKASQVNLTSIAHDNGFYDQMHFIKEMKKFTRLTPGEYLKAPRELQMPIFTRN
ncbi:helix-turn-helix domain-containing protein [Imperialibacter roseus]|uniref:Helix-turn-helix domain-containing protein n=1 Tax=Imperialibacter roseus TaxID=1324217 RepID=A0ABZ0ISH4_9BACT|nr:helix-turn-helix domain-containing protein [Imperialibacter roseus]WOK07452.1 helix-turn-helix domain-containing protein [Imperialibacter roseus]